MQRQRLVPYMLIAPSLLFLLLLFFIPLVQTVVLAFHSDAGLGFEKFRELLGDLDFTAAIKNTFGLVIVLVPLVKVPEAELDPSKVTVTGPPTGTGTPGSGPTLSDGASWIHSTDDCEES